MYIAYKAVRGLRLPAYPPIALQPGERDPRVRRRGGSGDPVAQGRIHCGRAGVFQLDWRDVCQPRNLAGAVRYIVL